VSALQQLYAQFRADTFDNSFPQLFTDAELKVWFNEAEVEAAIRMKLLRENSNVLLTQFDIRAGTMDYAVDSRMFEIVYASMVSKGSDGMLPHIMAITSAEEMDGVKPFWRTVPSRPGGIIHYDSSLRVDHIPDTEYTLHAEGYRLPIATMDTIAIAEVRATGSFTLTGGSSGSVSAVEVNDLDILGSAVAFITDLTTTAAALVTQINLNQNKYVASSVGAVVTLTDIATAGSLHNGYAVAVTATGITATTVAFSGGIDRVVTSPEINGMHHRHLIKWVLHRAYERPDAETFDPDKSARSLKQFEDYFGVRPDASMRKKSNASQPHRNVCYP